MLSERPPITISSRAWLHHCHVSVTCRTGAFILLTVQSEGFLFTSSIDIICAVRVFGARIVGSASDLLSCAITLNFTVFFICFAEIKGIVARFHRCLLIVIR